MEVLERYLVRAREEEEMERMREREMLDMLARFRGRAKGRDVTVAGGV